MKKKSISKLLKKLEEVKENEIAKISPLNQLLEKKFMQGGYGTNNQSCIGTINTVCTNFYCYASRNYLCSNAIC